jgi:hypothetical protein
MPRTRDPLKTAAIEADLRAEKLTDQEIRTKHQISITTLWRIRQAAGLGVERGIPDAERELLGRHADPELAEKWGVTRQAVAKARKAAGIPSFTSVERVRLAATPSDAHRPL